MRVVIVAALMAAMFSATAAHADDYPSRPIRMLLPFSAGGGGDTLGRYLAERFRVRLNQPVIVENKPGAGGTIGTHMAAKAPADGYTIAIGGMTTHILAPIVYAHIPYDPIKDFRSLGAIGTSSILMVANNDFPANNLAELKALAKSRTEPNVYKVLEMYADADALSAHGQTEYCQAAGPGIGACLGGRPSIEYLDAV